MSEARLTRWPDYRIEIRVVCATVACPPDEEVAISVAMVREYRVADKLADYLFGRGGRQQPSDSQLVALAWNTPTLGDRLWFTWTGIARRSEVREAAGDCRDNPRSRTCHPWNFRHGHRCHHDRDRGPGRDQNRHHHRSRRFRAVHRHHHRMRSWDVPR